MIIPAYGRQGTLARAIGSVRSQLGIAPEILVVDDGSPEPIRLPDTDLTHVRIIRSEKNCGAGPARNLGAAHASHDVLAFLDSDDEWTPGGLRPRLRLLEPGVCVVASHRTIDDLTGSTRDRFVPQAVGNSLLGDNPISPSSIVVLNRDYNLIGGFPDDRDCAEDWVFLLRALKADIRIRSVPAPVALTHLDSSNTTFDIETQIRHVLGAVRHIEIEGLLAPHELARTRRVTYARIAGFYANAARWREACKYLRLALPGLREPSVASRLLDIPVQAARGAVRRQWRVSGPLPPQTLLLPQLCSGAVVVVAGNPAEAWVRRALDELADIVADLSFVEAPQVASLRQHPLGRWRLERSGQPDASQSAYVTHDVRLFSDLPRLASEAALVLDLSGRESYKPISPSDAPVVRIRFGPQRQLHAHRSFEAAVAGRRAVDELIVTLEWKTGAAALRRAPVAVNSSSRSLTYNAALWKAAATLPRAVTVLLSGSTQPRPAVNAIGAVPGQRIAAHAVGGRRLVSHAVEQAFTRPRWSVAIQPIDDVVPATDTVASADTEWIHEPDTIADPWLLERDADTYLFVERQRIGQHGVIAVARIGEDGHPEPLHDALVTDRHLSYPTVFEDAGDTWLLPESASTRKIQLFRAEEFPQRWSSPTTLINDIVAYDPTLHRNDDGYWLFACVSRFGLGHDDELWLFHSNALTGPWRPHPDNPVVEDPRRARPAGALFFAEGRLVRPSQDGSERYGKRIVLNEVLELNERRYRECQIATIEPSWSPGLLATHTISRAGKWQALDGAHRVLAAPVRRERTHLSWLASGS